MRVTALAFETFRNLAQGEIHPCEGVNILYGDNAQGKTNCLEALWMFTAARSFRGAKERDMVQKGAACARLSLQFYAQGREQEATLCIDHARHATLNGVPLKGMALLAGQFCGVVFSPAHLSLIKEGPQARRKFIDGAYCPLRPAFIHTLYEYNKALMQRNALLKNGVNDDQLLSPWEQSLAALGARVIRARRGYIDTLTPYAQEIYHGLSGGREPFDIAYRTRVQGDTAEAVAQALYAQLRTSRAEDMRMGFTTVGPHRDDVEVRINGMSARTFGSQGQQRSAVLALKMAEAAVMRDMTGEKPVMLLDDVMSELDPKRQDYILNHLDGWQVFITCCEPSTMIRLTGGRAFYVDGGHIRKGMSTV